MKKPSQRQLLGVVEHIGKCIDAAVEHLEKQQLDPLATEFSEGMVRVLGSVLQKNRLPVPDKAAAIMLKYEQQDEEKRQKAVIRTLQRYCRQLKKKGKDKANG